MFVSVLGPRAVHVISSGSPRRIVMVSSLGEMTTSSVVGSTGSVATDSVTSGAVVVSIYARNVFF